MIDLNKLQEKFDKLFEKETEALFNNWLNEKKKKEVMTFLEKGSLLAIQPKTRTD